MGESRLEENRPKENESKEDRPKEKKPRFRLTGSIPAKVAALLIMLTSLALCALGGAVCFIAAEADMYINSYRTVQENVLHGMAFQVAHNLYNCFGSGYEESAVLYLQERNAEAAVIKLEDAFASDSSVFLWQSYEGLDAKEGNGFYSGLYADINMGYLPFYKDDGGASFDDERNAGLIVRVFFDPDFPLDDDIRRTAKLAELMYEGRYAAIALCAGGAVLAFICGVFLLCAAGHRNGREGIVQGFLTGIPFDLLTAGFFTVLLLFVGLLDWLNVGDGFFVLALCAAGLILGILYLWDFAIRVKLGKFWRNTLIYRILRLLWRILRMACRVIAKIPLVWGTVAVYLAICFLEFLWMGLFGRTYPSGVFLWMLEKIILFAVVLYVALAVRKLLEASRELAEGHAEHRVDTKYMIGAFKEQGENLNSLGQGVSRAVAERMKSERFKTELITNVSHDLKTPLTSIINYTELISREAGDCEENAALREYAEVLLRQSHRLKKLLENLVEASKAVTGNLEVNLESCEVDVLLSQAVGEYQQRLEERRLELRVSQPEEPVKILADGRHLWRVFDNLLNNICKYAQEGSRVYLTLERQESRVLIIFRNMSRYALDISPAELEERFVRGDKSRHLEGNGLGLSIAKSLTELQGGQMDIVIDGDLFKVTLTFEALNKP